MKFFLASLLVVLAIGARAQDNTTTTQATTTEKTTTEKTTTIKTTASTAKTTPSTAKTTPSTAKTTASTAKTTPAPTVPTNKYNVTDNKVTCVLMQAAISFDITYTKKDNSTASVTVAIPKDFDMSGTCGNTSDVLDIQFFQKTWKLEFDFKNESSSSYYVSAVDLTYVLDSRFPGAAGAGETKMVSLKPKKDFIKANSNGYTCTAQQKLTNDGVTVMTKDLKVLAFNNNEKPAFASGALECSADDDTNSIVPIAVGAALAGLVVIVLIAYLIGRKRTRKTGYESV